MRVIKKISLTPPNLGPRLQRAFGYAAEKHAGQTRKQTAVPYLSHLMAVASLVLEAGGDEDMAIAALLHDVVEDCGGMPRLREVRKRFGPRVAKIVEGCTDAFVEPKPEWMERKKNYLREVKHADAETRLVSASDKLHNVRTILADYRQDGESIWKRFSGKKEGTLWYYRALSDEYPVPKSSSRRGIPIFRKRATNSPTALRLPIRKLSVTSRRKSPGGRPASRTTPAT